MYVVVEETLVVADLVVAGVVNWALPLLLEATYGAIGEGMEM